MYKGEGRANILLAINSVHNRPRVWRRRIWGTEVSQLGPAICKSGSTCPYDIWSRRHWKWHRVY